MQAGAKQFGDGGAEINESKLVASTEPENNEEKSQSSGSPIMPPWWEDCPKTPE